MTETQQYRVVADRSTDDVYGVKREPFDRVTYGPLGHDIVRIERPVPTEPCLSTAHHDAHEWGGHVGKPATGYWCEGFDASDEAPHPPTREQIAAVIAEAHAIRNAYLNFWGAHSSSDIARVGREPEMPATPTIDAWSAAMIQNGADRG